MADLYQAMPALTGKIELVYEGEQEGLSKVARLLIGKAVEKVFKRYFPEAYKPKPRGAGMGGRAAARAAGHGHTRSGNHVNYRQCGIA